VRNLAGYELLRRVGLAHGVEVQQHRHQLDRAHAVDHRVVDLGDDGEAIVLQSLDDPQLPQRLAAIELLGRQPAHEVTQLIIVSGSWQRCVADVVVDGEVLVIDPHRRPLDRHMGEPLAVAGHEMQLRCDELTDALDVDAAAVTRQIAGLEHGEAGDVHVGHPRLEREKRVVEIRKPLVEAHVERLAIEDSGEPRDGHTTGFTLALRRTPGHRASRAPVGDRRAAVS
jgi:hypothetical protein